MFTTLQGLIAHELAFQGNLPAKYEDLSLEPGFIVSIVPDHEPTTVVMNGVETRRLRVKRGTPLTYTVTYNGYTQSRTLTPTQNEVIEVQVIPPDLVLDSCICYLDGINNNGNSHVEKPSTWVNRMGNTTYNANVSNINAVTWTDNSAILGSSSDSCYTITKNITGVSQSFSIECVFKTPRFGIPAYGSIWAGGTKLHIWDGSLEGCICSRKIDGGSKYAYVYSGGFNTLNQITYACHIFEKNVGQRLWHSQSKAFGYNTDQKTNASYVGQAMYIGRDRQSYVDGAGLNIYAFRYHTRVLSDAEILRNYEADRYRYKF